MSQIWIRVELEDTGRVKETYLRIFKIPSWAESDDILDKVLEAIDEAKPVE